MPDPDRFVARLRRRMLLGEASRVAAGWLVAFLLAFGGALLAAKLFAPRQLTVVYWSSLAIVPLGVFVLWRASRRLPSDRDSIALLDSRLGAGGLLMALCERPDARWREKLPPAEAWAAALPRFRPARFARVVAIPAIFAAGAGVVPSREQPAPPPQVVAGADAARELAETFELLDRAGALDEEAKTTLRRELDGLAAEAAEKPLTHEKWETVDALRERMRTGLDVTDLTVSKGRTAAAVLGAAASAAAQPLSAERAEQVSEDLAAAVETLKRNGAFARAAAQAFAGVPPEVQELLKSGEFRLPADPAERAEALGQLATLLEGEQKRLAEARGQAGSLLGGMLSPDDLFRQVGSQLAGLADDGGADQTFGRESKEQAAKFKEAVLPPGFLDNPNEETAGVTASAPKIDVEGAVPRNAARDAAASGSGVTWDRSLRPRHRDIVRRYFDDG